MGCWGTESCWQRVEVQKTSLVVRAGYLVRVGKESRASLLAALLFVAEKLAGSFKPQEVAKTLRRWASLPLESDCDLSVSQSSLCLTISMSMSMSSEYVFFCLCERCVLTREPSRTHCSVSSETSRGIDQYARATRAFGAILNRF